MKRYHTKMKGSISSSLLVGILATALGGSYFYIDQKADAKASQTMISLVDNAKSQGVELSYGSIDASPITQSVEITDLIITGQEVEPDIHLGNLVIKGFQWQDLNSNRDQLPKAMHIDINQGELLIKDSMLINDSDLQTLVSLFGDTISFNTNIAYELNTEQNLINLSLNQRVEENFVFGTDITLGNIGWITDIDAEQTHVPSDVMYQAISSTLNSLSVSYTNLGLIEKIRTLVKKETGKTDEQLVQESIAQLRQLQVISANNWGSLFTPMIDEMITFTRDPNKLLLTINPKQPITGQDFMMAMMGGETALVSLVENARIQLKAD